MVLGYGIIAVPTGIVTAEMTKNKNVDLNTQSCPYCMIKLLTIQHVVVLRILQQFEFLLASLLDRANQA